MPPARDLLRLIQAKGTGYAISTQEELKTIMVGIQPIWTGAEAAALFRSVRFFPHPRA